MWPDRPDFIAIDGKTARRTHDRRKGVKALHTLSAYATRPGAFSDRDRNAPKLADVAATLRS